MMKNERRHKKIIMTPEAVALREIRCAKGLSIREVCKALQKSEGFLRHIETGRRDFPNKDLLEMILKVYDVTYKSFRHRVTAVVEASSKLGPKDELKGLVDGLSEEKTELVLKMLKSIIS